MCKDAFFPLEILPRKERERNTIENCKEMGDGLCCAVNGTDLVLVAFFGRENGPLFSAKKSPKKGMIYDTQKGYFWGAKVYHRVKSVTL